MSLADIIILVCVIIFIGVILIFNIKSLKKGNKCCNCPYSKQCKNNNEKIKEKDCCIK